MRRLLLLAVLGVLAAACSGDYDRYPEAAEPSTTTQPPTSLPTTAPPSTTTTSSSTTTSVPPGATTTTVPGATTTTAPPTPGVAPGRLGIVADDGALVTVRADGTEVTTITDAPPGGTVVQLAWSPDATRLAFSTTTSREASVGVGAVDGSPPIHLPFTTAPYHLAWDAAQTRLAYLRVDSVDTVELGALDASVTAPPTRLRSGAPVTAAWSPDGSRLIAVVGEDELTLVDPTGVRTPLAELPAPSGAPAWIDAQHVLVAVRTGADQRLVLLDVDTGVTQELLIYTGSITFLPDAGGNRIAYQVVPDDGGGGSGGRVSFPRPRARIQGDPPLAEEGVLAVLDRTTGESREVLDEPAQAFQWSPDGTRLAFLDPQDASSSRWRFWTADAAGGGAALDGPQFVPSPTFVELIQPYFDQLAPAQDWWSPDGRAFTFAGRVQGREGVWVVPTTARAAPTFVHDGEVVAWSPR
jgi:dipeptidyl aminopeptidase/acylaminoacyl peptidase